MPVIVQRQVRGQIVQKAVLVPQLPFIDGRRHPSHGAEAGSHGFPCSEDHRDSAVAVCFLVVDVPVCRSCRFFVAVCVKTVEIPQFLSSSLSWRRCRFPWSVYLETLQLQYIGKVVDVMPLLCWFAGSRCRCG